MNTHCELLSNGRFGCIKCATQGRDASFISEVTFKNHYKKTHIPLPCQKKTKVTVTPKGEATVDNMSDLITKAVKRVMAETMAETMAKTMAKITEQVAAIKPQVVNVTNNNSNNNNINMNMNIYFNKELKYYPELVKLLGKKEASDYLLFTMPESKDFFGVIRKLVENGGCPIKTDGSGFVVLRNESEHVSDPTGELLDRENKNKLEVAVLSAYNESTKEINAECERIRLSRVNEDYTKEDEAILNSRFEGIMEPTRPHQIISMIKQFKPKRKDYDSLRGVCTSIEKKVVYNY